jgi:hypothetical protein
MEGILTTRTTISLIGQFVQLTTFAARAKPLMVFEAFSQQIFSSFILAAD